MENKREVNISRQIDKKKTKHVRINTGIHHLLKVKAAKEGTTIRNLIESQLAELLAIEPDEIKVKVN